MVFHVVVDQKVLKFLGKLPANERRILSKKIDGLKKSKRGYRQIGKIGEVEFWELRCSSHRIYYQVEENEIIIENILYDGQIQITDFSNKNQQQRTINKMKKKIRK